MDKLEKVVKDEISAFKIYEKRLKEENPERLNEPMYTVGHVIDLLEWMLKEAKNGRT